MRAVAAGHFNLAVQSDQPLCLAAPLVFLGRRKVALPHFFKLRRILPQLDGVRRTASGERRRTTIRQLASTVIFRAMEKSQPTTGNPNAMQLTIFVSSASVLM
jgi:hypothetical protein